MREQAYDTGEALKKLNESDYAQFAREHAFSFARHSSIGCGGNAEIAFYPQSAEEMKALVKLLRGRGVPYLVLGNLTNVLPLDEGFEGAVISTKRMNGIVKGKKLFAYAGANSATLLAAAKKENLSGIEFLLGIPCTLGGALYMNAGAAGKYIAEVVESVLVLREGQEILLPVEECGYAYKKSAFMESEDIILGASLRLTPSTPSEIEERENRYAARRAHLPNGKSMGCVFKNPEGGFAGDLIERSGLKGFRIGGAKISEEHANFIINDGGGTAREIRALIALAKNAVRAQYGIELEEEIRYLNGR